MSKIRLPKIKLQDYVEQDSSFFNTLKVNKQVLRLINIALILYIPTFLFSKSLPLTQRLNTTYIILSILLFINVLNQIKFCVNYIKYIYPIIFSITILIILANEKGSIDNVFVFFPVIALSVLYGKYSILAFSSASTILIMSSAFIIKKDLFFPTITTYQFESILISLILTASFFLYIIRKETAITSQAYEEKRNAKKAVESLQKTLMYLDTAYSKLKDTQTQLVQHEKMASLGMLVAGVAHEINNPIGAINCNVGLYNTLISRLKMTESINEDPSAASLVQKLDDANKTNLIACDRILAIVKSLRNFARLDESEFKEADIHVGIDSTLILLSSKIKTKVDVIKNYGTIPPILCYPNQLNQVFMNLIVNAIDAVPETGHIWITTTCDDSNVTIIIKDSGTGMTPETIKKIFDPGFTTKGVGVGTGLGLSIVYNIIEKHKGSISVNSELGKGTEFTIKLPIKKAPAQQ
ncbi:MAG: sensor histidine kinase [Deltaproteobacteria bacterium]